MTGRGDEASCKSPLRRSVNGAEAGQAAAFTSTTNDEVGSRTPSTRRATCRKALHPLQQDLGSGGIRARCQIDPGVIEQVQRRLLESWPDKESAWASIEALLLKEARARCAAVEAADVAADLREVVVTTGSELDEVCGLTGELQLELQISRREALHAKNEEHCISQKLEAEKVRVSALEAEAAADRAALMQCKEELERLTGLEVGMSVAAERAVAIKTMFSEAKAQYDVSLEQCRAEARAYEAEARSYSEAAQAAFSERSNANVASNRLQHHHGERESAQAAMMECLQLHQCVADLRQRLECFGPCGGSTETCVNKGVEGNGSGFSGASTAASATSDLSSEEATVWPSSIVGPEDIRLLEDLEARLLSSLKSRSILAAQAASEAPHPPQHLHSPPRPVPEHQVMMGVPPPCSSPSTKVRRLVSSPAMGSSSLSDPARRLRVQSPSPVLGPTHRPPMVASPLVASPRPPISPASPRTPGLPQLETWLGAATAMKKGHEMLVRQPGIKVMISTADGGSTSSINTPCGTSVGGSVILSSSPKKRHSSPQMSSTPDLLPPSPVRTRAVLTPTTSSVSPMQQSSVQSVGSPMSPGRSGGSLTSRNCVARQVSAGKNGGTPLLSGRLTTSSNTALSVLSARSLRELSVGRGAPPPMTTRANGAGANCSSAGSVNLCPGGRTTTAAVCPPPAGRRQTRRSSTGCVPQGP
mmetsp:Transcript_103074/g.204643  ORF Transcript_103074/g.204643 Transcript_103074/m.204643 type:complete len:702 (+) Transcript_103074:97-2202(+)